jgi:hypothetical protein
MPTQVNNSAESLTYNDQFKTLMDAFRRAIDVYEPAQSKVKGITLEDINTLTTLKDEGKITDYELDLVMKSLIASMVYATFQETIRKMIEKPVPRKSARHIMKQILSIT